MALIVSQAITERLSQLERIVLQSVIFKTNYIKLFLWLLRCWIILTEDIFMWKSKDFFGHCRHLANYPPNEP